MQAQSCIFLLLATWTCLLSAAPSIADDCFKTEVSIGGTLSNTADLTKQENVLRSFDSLDDLRAAGVALPVLDVSLRDTIGDAHTMHVLAMRTDTSVWTIRAFIKSADLGFPGSGLEEVSRTYLEFKSDGALGFPQSLSARPAWIRTGYHDEVLVRLNNITNGTTSSALAELTRHEAVTSCRAISYPLHFRGFRATDGVLVLQ